jgi:hypothetical protein
VKTPSELREMAANMRTLAVLEDQAIASIYARAAEAYEQLAKRRELANDPVRAFIERL